jgi:hypothetical protein
MSFPQERSQGVQVQRPMSKVNSQWEHDVQGPQPDSQLACLTHPSR